MLAVRYALILEGAGRAVAQRRRVVCRRAENQLRQHPALPVGRLLRWPVETRLRAVGKDAVGHVRRAGQAGRCLEPGAGLGHGVQPAGGLRTEAPAGADHPVHRPEGPHGDRPRPRITGAEGHAGQLPGAEQGRGGGDPRRNTGRIRRAGPFAAGTGSETVQRRVVEGVEGALRGARRAMPGDPLPHDAQHVIQQRGGGDFRARARPLDQQRLALIAIAVDGHAVVGARALRQWMIGRQLAQAHLRTLAIDATDKTQHAAVVARLLPACLQRRIQLFQRGYRIFQRQRGERFRHQRIHLHLRRVQRQPAAAGQDQQLAAYILAGQVQARIRLGVACRQRFAHCGRER
ncbi:hypothetical protein G6F59_013386 [Rhizopus arrhizus]|nr:hypothetical protein G6F59_013386 [Rhizopus arrhizus]